MSRIEKEVGKRETNSTKVKQSQPRSNKVKQSENNLQDCLRQVWSCLVLYDPN
jgi:hypothetical protein